MINANIKLIMIFLMVIKYNKNGKLMIINLILLLWIIIKKKLNAIKYVLDKKHNH